MSLLTLSSLPNPSDSLAGTYRQAAERVRSGLSATAALWRQRRLTRRHLGGLDDRLLADVGLTRAQQHIECAKAPWRL